MDKSKTYMGRGTNAQANVIEDFITNGHKLFDQLVQFGLHAYSAKVKLPAINEEGNAIVHGNNLEVSKIAQSYFEAAQAFKNKSRHFDEKLVDMEAYQNLKDMY